AMALPPPVPITPDTKALIAAFERQIETLVPGDVQSTARHLRIGRVIEYVDQHYQEHLTLDHLASVVGRHKVSLADDFKEQTGLTVHAYVTKVRVTRAA